VLDIGATAIEKDGTWLHREISGVCSDTVGIDIINGDGIQQVNAEKPYWLGRRFDVVVAAEVIDHVSNLGIFLENIKAHMNDNGIAVISSHNPQALEFFLEHWITGLAFKKVTNHTHWQSIVTMRTLLNKHGLKLESYKYIHFIAGSRIGKVYDYLTWFMPARFSRSILYVAKHS